MAEKFLECKTRRMDSKPVSPPEERHSPLARYALLLSFVLLGLLLLFLSLPGVLGSLNWRWEELRGMFRDTFYRTSDTLPMAVGTARVQESTPPPAAIVVSDFTAHGTATPSPLPTDQISPTPAATATPITYTLYEPPAAFQLTGFKHEYQKPNNCGPTTLAILLKWWGWQGDQDTIGNVLKPTDRDKNVRWDELTYYVKTHAGWLDAMFRVGGDFEMLKLFVTNGYPVIIETGYQVRSGWVGHFLLVTGYDSTAKTFTVQDATGGPDLTMRAEKVNELWQQFNRLYILVYPVGDAGKVAYMLGDNADESLNREQALAQAKSETESDPKNAFAWFNYGSNLAYFDRFEQASTAFDKAREIGLPWRMLFYQFGPYRAYFYTGRYQDVEDLANATLGARPDLEESYVWRGWARYMLGQHDAAVADFYAALEVHPGFDDAEGALRYLGLLQ